MFSNVLIGKLLNTCRNIDVILDVSTRLDMLHSELTYFIFAGHLYVVGGFTGDNCLTHGEYYSPETNQWSMITHMLTPRSGLGKQKMDWMF